LAPIAISQADRIKLVNPPAQNLQKGDDGLLRLKDGGKADRSDGDADLGNARIEQRQCGAIADQHDRAAAPVRISDQEHELDRYRTNRPPNS
jgi:hypothetical protein